MDEENEKAKISPWEGAFGTVSKKSYKLEGEAVSVTRTFKVGTSRWVEIQYQDGSQKEVLYRDLERIN